MLRFADALHAGSAGSSFAAFAIMLLIFKLDFS